MLNGRTNTHTHTHWWHVCEKTEKKYNVGWLLGDKVHQHQFTQRDHLRQLTLDLTGSFL